MNSDILSIIAVTISAISLGISFYHLFQDRAYINVDSIFINRGSATGSFLIVNIKNSGRRPLIIRSWGLREKSNYWQSFSLGETNKGIEIGEKGFYEFRIEFSDVAQHIIESELVNLWVEDSLNRRYKIKNAVKHVKKFNDLPMHNI